MSALTYFTAIGTYKAATADSTSDVDADPDLVPVFGRIRFTPLIRAGDSIQGTTLTPPTSLVLRPITVPLVGGQVSLNGTTGVRLVANTSALNLTGALVYQVDFFDLQARSDSVDLRSFNFTAPTSDTVVDLVSVTPVAGTTGVGTTQGPQGAGVTGVHLNSPGQVVFEVSSTNLPPIDLSLLTYLTVDGGTPASAGGIAVLDGGTP